MTNSSPFSTMGPMRFFLFLVLCAGPSLSAFAESDAPGLPNLGLEIVQRFGGSAKMLVSDRLEAKEPPPLLITDQASFERFLALLPSDQGKTGGTDPSTDSLARVPRFDWSRYMLLVVFDSQTLSFPPNISQVGIRARRLVAVVDYPDVKNLIEAKPPEIGSYGAALVVRSDLPLEWSNPGHKAQEAQRQSMMMFLPKSEQ